MDRAGDVLTSGSSSSSSLSRIRHERRRGVDYVWLVSPQNRNALSLQMLSELIDVTSASAGDGESRALIIDHDGPVFCAGIDVVERRTAPPGPPNHSTLFAELLRRLWDYPKPLITRVGGAVRGGGMGIVACADITVATADATFAYSEVNVGVAPALVGALAIVKLGAGRLMPWLLTGDAFDADIASQLGLVTNIALDDGVAELDEVIDSLGSAGPSAVATTKSIARRCLGIDVAALLGEMTIVSATAFASDEGQEGMRAFAEKRPPSWHLGVTDTGTSGDRNRS